MSRKNTLHVCGTCSHCSVGKEWGRCRRNPPVAVARSDGRTAATDEEIFAVGWPRVSLATDWCSEYDSCFDGKFPPKAP